MKIFRFLSTLSQPHPPSQEGVQALFPRQAALVSPSQGGVQALIPRQTELFNIENAKEAKSKTCIVL